jgi:ABC-type phosphate transport system substrate-binding protein
MRCSKAIRWPLGLALFALCATGLADTRPVPVYVVIVEPSNEVTSLERKFLEGAFLKKITRWPNSSALRPADLAPNSAVRRKFTEEVLNRSVEAVQGYWQQRIFSGRDVPPPEFDTDRDVVDYVLKHVGAVGYVSGAADLGGAKVLAVR